MVSNCTRMILRISLAADKQPTWGEIPDINHIWMALFRRMAISIQGLNMAIKEDTDPDVVIRNIVSILASEVRRAQRWQRA